MANENETVEQVCEKYQSVMPIPTGEIIAAHKRELAAKDEERLTVAANYESVIEAKDRINEAKDRVISAKIAEIARLKRENFDLNGCLLAEQESVEKRDTLIKDMTVALSGSLEIVGNVSEFLSLDCGTALRIETYRETLTKAREVTSG